MTSEQAKKKYGSINSTEMTENKQQDVPWVWKGKPVEPKDVPVDAVGMVYRITEYPDATYIKLLNSGVGMILPGTIRCYIGKKVLTSNRKQKIGKRAIAAEKASRADGKAKTVRRVIKDSGWLSYNSSCKPLQEAIKTDPGKFYKEILHWCFSKKNMSLMETVEQVRHNVLWINSWNDHIGNWWRHDTDKQLYEEHLQRMREKPRKPRKKKEICH
jgi:Putative endonuclease segE, GIY-YIG domain